MLSIVSVNKDSLLSESFHTAAYSAVVNFINFLNHQKENVSPETLDRHKVTVSNYFKQDLKGVLPTPQHENALHLFNESALSRRTSLLH
jgi:hypothetical protein